MKPQFSNSCGVVLRSVERARKYTLGYIENKRIRNFKILVYVLFSLPRSGFLSGGTVFDVVFSNESKNLKKKSKI